jgi:hypothetical protein
VRRPIYILAHALASGAFMFCLQTLALRATVETALAWAAVFGLAAAGLAWHQSNR